MITAHIIDQRGVYLRTEYVDQSGPQPAGALYGELPDAQDGYTRMWLNGAWQQVLDVDVPALPEPVQPSQFEKDQSRYQKRAAVKDELMAYMAADNMGRVRSGVWSVADLTSLLDDPAVVAANALMGSLSFELSAAQIQAATTPLLTPEIKADWVSRLQAHYYLEG